MPENNPAPDSTPQVRRAAVVINPAKSVGPALQGAILRLCETQGWAEPLWLETTVEDPGAGQARQALEAGVDVVIAAGGDGTVRCVAEVLAGTGTPMGLVPLGTGNLLARNLGVDITDPVSACYDVLNGSEKAIDVVKARLNHSDDEQVFLVMAGLGYDAAIMADTVDVLKDRMGWLAYVEAGIRKLPGKPVKAQDQRRRRGTRPPQDPQRHDRQLRPDHGRGRDLPGCQGRRRRAGPAGPGPARPARLAGGCCRDFRPEQAARPNQWSTSRANPPRSPWSTSRNSSWTVTTSAPERISPWPSSATP